jgi:hypothetical protein
MTLWLQPHYWVPSEALWILRFWFLLFMRLFTLLVSILFFDLFVSLLENFVWMAGWWATMHSSDDQTLEVMITINNSLSLLTDGNYIPRFLYFVKIFVRLWKYELFWYNCDLQYKKVLYFRLVNLMLNHSFWPKVERMEPETQPTRIWVRRVDSQIFARARVAVSARGRVRPTACLLEL